jgi:LacI family transcriptional regulator
MSQSIKPHVTVRDIATATGLHHTTVSLGLRNSPRLRPETLRKIQEAAKNLGYTPDPMLSALNAYRQSKRAPHYQATIAWINNWSEEDEMLGIDTFRQYYEGARDRCRQLGYSLEEFWLAKPGMNPERMIGILRARSIQGLLMPPQPYARTISPIDYGNFSAVAFGYTIQPPVLNVVTNHHYHSMNLLVSKLMELGYRGIGLNTSRDWDEKVENAWVGGLKLACWKHPELVPIPHYDKWNEDPGFALWLKKYKPDVLVSLTLGEQMLKELGYSVPKDIGFASLDLPFNEKAISGLNENSFYIGQKAVDVLVGLLHRGERGLPEVPTRLLVESTWVPGKTLRQQDAAPHRAKTAIARP